MVAPALLSSQTDEWSTPQALFDGLKQDWSGETIWCNPPYGRHIGEWVKKCAEHWGVAVMLIPARTDTRWWHEYIANNPTANVRFIKGRLKFGGAANPAPFPSAIVIFFNTTLDEWGGVN